jgi:hypothetical protein
MMDPPALDGSLDTATKSWVFPTVAAGSVFAASVATACVCIFAISLPILPVLAACIVVAAVLIGVIVWRTIITGENGWSNGFGPIPDMENLANGGRGIDFSRLTTLRFQGCDCGKPLFRGDAKDSHSFFFTAESFDKALKKCSDVTRLVFKGSVPEDLIIKADDVRNLCEIKFFNISSMGNFNGLGVFDAQPENLNVVTFKNCNGPTTASVAVNMTTRFQCCGDLRTIRVGNGPFPADAGSSSVLLGDDVFPGEGNHLNTTVEVEDCNSFDTNPERMRGFDSIKETVTMELDGTSLSTEHSKSNRDSNFVCSTKVANFTEYRPVESIKILSEPTEFGGKILFRLPEGLSAKDEVAITYQPQETDVVEKPVTLDFVPSKRIVLNSIPSAVKHIILPNKHIANSNEKNRCIVEYQPANGGIVEFGNFTYSSGRDADFYEIVNNGCGPVNLPKIKLGGKDLSVTWFNDGLHLCAIASKYADDFRKQTQNQIPAPVELTNDIWKTGTHLCFNAAWL